MRYYLDTEFHEEPGSIELISIGIVAEDGREFYAESSEYDEGRAFPWLRENVLAHLGPKEKRATRAEIAADALSFVRYDDLGREIEGRPEFWGYYADYDWVVFCWLFGAMIDLPHGFPMYCGDIKQFADDLGNPRLPEHDEAEHNALADARWNKKAWHYLSRVAMEMDT
jgi:hypothetical protein